MWTKPFLHLLLLTDSIFFILSVFSFPEGGRYDVRHDFCSVTSSSLLFFVEDPLFTTGMFDKFLMVFVFRQNYSEENECKIVSFFTFFFFLFSDKN